MKLIATVIQSLAYRLVTARQPGIRALLITVPTALVFRFFGWKATPEAVAAFLMHAMVAGLSWLHDVVWTFFLLAVCLAVGAAVAQALAKEIGEVADRLADFDSSTSTLREAYDRLRDRVIVIVRRLFSKRPKPPEESETEG